jgi:hypothetical protein
MKLLSILALVAIGAKAHWNDREPSFIMQQTVKYDADTEAKLASERQVEHAHHHPFPPARLATNKTRGVKNNRWDYYYAKPL